VSRLANALRALLGRDRTPDRRQVLADLERRVLELEAVRAGQLAEWLEWQERMTRTLSRLAARDQRAKQDQDPNADARALALRLKFPRSGA
jgi:hypothetical protein